MKNQFYQRFDAFKECERSVNLAYDMIIDAAKSEHSEVQMRGEYKDNYFKVVLVTNSYSLLRTLIQVMKHAGFKYDETVEASSYELYFSYELW